MKRVIDCGLADFGLKHNSRIFVEVELSNDNVLSICANVRGIGSGQCLETIRKAVGKSNPMFNILYRWWKLYHLNDMHAGTIAQEKALENFDSTDYNDRCAYLESVCLLYDSGYRYGSKWLKREIPKYVIADIKSVIVGKI